MKVYVVKKLKIKNKDGVKKPKPAVSIRMSVAQIEEQIPMSASISITQQVILTATPEDAKGNPAPVDGVPEWQLSNPAVCSITPAADGLTATVKAIAIGACTVKAIADADLGAGVKSIEGTFDVTVTAAQAVSVVITAGTPTEQV